jgi:hypothetical protein
MVKRDFTQRRKDAKFRKAQPSKANATRLLTVDIHVSRMCDALLT